MTTPPDSFERPPFALKVGLVGNRRFGSPGSASDAGFADSMATQAGAACEIVWKEITAGMRDVWSRPLPGLAGAASSHQSPSPGVEQTPRTLADFFAPGPAYLTVLTGLAAGVDQLGARAAVNCRRKDHAEKPEAWPVTIRLEGIAPFCEADFPGNPQDPRPEFTRPEAAEFYDLATECAQLVRLDGVYGLPGDERSDDSRNDAYAQVRDMILQNSDLLVAVFDPNAAARKAGTVETVRQALASGVPTLVILLAADGAHAALYRLPDEFRVGDLAAPPMSDASWRERLRQTLDHLLALPHAMALADEDEHQRVQRQHAYKETVEQLEEFLIRPVSSLAAPHVIRSAVFSAGWRFVCWLGARFGRPHGFVRYGVPIPNASWKDMTVSPYRQAYQRADAFSRRYMDVYRGAFPLAFLLAGVATSTAVSMMVVGAFTSGHPPLALVVALGVSKVGILLFLLWLEHNGHRRRWQEHAAEHRYMAELLRPMEWLAALGTAPPTVEMPAQYASLDPRQSWMPWLFRAMARGALSVCPTETISAPPGPRGEVIFSRDTARRALTQARDEWLSDQRAYHARAAQSNHAIENGLERIGKFLLYAVLGCAVAAFGLELGERWWHPLPSWLEGRLPGAIVILTALAAALPAFIAAIGGIIFQSEAKRLESRSEEMFHSLAAQQKKLTEWLDALETSPPAHGGTARIAAEQLRTLAGVVIAETGDWKALYQTQEIKAG